MALTLSGLRPAYSLGTWISAMAMAGLPAYAADRTIEDTPTVENEGSGYPKIEGTLLTEIENDSVLDSDDISAEISDIFATLELATGIYLNRNLSLQSLIVFEPTQDPFPFQDRFFEDHGTLPWRVRQDGSTQLVQQQPTIIFSRSAEATKSSMVCLQERASTLV